MKQPARTQAPLISSQTIATGPGAVLWATVTNTSVAQRWYVFYDAVAVPSVAGRGPNPTVLASLPAYPIAAGALWVPLAALGGFSFERFENGLTFAAFTDSLYTTLAPADASVDIYTVPA